MARPKYRLMAKHRDSGKLLEVGAVWDGKFEGALNLKFHGEDGDERHLNVFDKRVKPEDFFFNLYLVTDKADGQPAKKRQVQDEDF